MSTDVSGKKKLPVTTILVAIALALLLLACGGGGLYLDYHAGSFSSTFLPGEGDKPMVTPRNSRLADCKRLRRADLVHGHRGVDGQA